MSHGGDMPYYREPNQDGDESWQRGFCAAQRAWKSECSGRFRVCLILPHRLRLKENRTSIENEKCEDEDM
jgi:hypothetical protein